MNIDTRNHPWLEPWQIRKALVELQPPQSPSWLSIDPSGCLHVDAALALSEMGLENNPANAAMLTEKIKEWTKESCPEVPVVEEWEL